MESGLLFTRLRLVRIQLLTPVPLILIVGFVGSGGTLVRVLDVGRVVASIFRTHFLLF